MLYVLWATLPQGRSRRPVHCSRSSEPLPSSLRTGLPENRRETREGRDHWRRPGRPDRRLRIARADGDPTHRPGDDAAPGRPLADGPVPRQPHRYRRAPLLLQVGPRDAVVAGADAAGGRRRRRRAFRPTGLGVPRRPIARSRDQRQRDAAAQTPLADLLPAEVLRLPAGPQPGYGPQAWAGGRSANRTELPCQRRGAHPAGGQPGAVLHQPLRPGTLPHLLRVLHGEGLGRALRRSTPSGAPSGSRGSR